MVTLKIPIEILKKGSVDHTGFIFCHNSIFCFTVHIDYCNCGGVAHSVKLKTLVTSKFHCIISLWLLFACDYKFIVGSPSCHLSILFSVLYLRMNSGSDASGKSKPSLPVSDGTSAKYVVKEVQPEPRRLFGFGPLYRPLPETVLERQETAPTSITEKVKQTGLTAVGTDSIDAGGTAQRKTSKVDNKQGEISKTTKRETSMWMPFSF